MRLIFCAIFLYFHYCESKLWSRGIVHYDVNTKDYDPNSQDIIVSTLARLEKEICIKFFKTPLNHSLANNEKILYIENPKKKKDCTPQTFKFNKPVVNMQIGYKCLNHEEISMIVLNMLRASVGDAYQSAVKPNSYKLIKTFHEEERANNTDGSETLLSKKERDYINTKYLEECGQLVQKPIIDARRSHGGTIELTADNERFYKDKLWPLGLVMYGVEKSAMSSPEFPLLRQAMATVELHTCVVFEYMAQDEPLQPKNLVLWFGTEGEEFPQLGFMQGNQSILLSSMIEGAPGHNAHTLNMLMRILGIPMMSNRYDRTNYVNIKWDKVAKTKERFLERAPLDAWLKNSDGEGSAYDFDSVTHAPANYMCGDCSLGQQTVEPIQDHLWQRTLSMGHRTDLSPADVDMVNLLYNRECQLRAMDGK